MDRMKVIQKAIRTRKKARTMAKDYVRLLEVREVIIRIESQVSKKEYRSIDEQSTSAPIVRDLRSIERTRDLMTLDFKANHPDFPWPNLLFLNENSVDEEAIGRCLEQDLPNLKREIGRILDELR